MTSRDLALALSAAGLAMLTTAAPALAQRGGALGQQGLSKMTPEQYQAFQQDVDTQRQDQQLNGQLQGDPNDITGVWDLQDKPDSIVTLTAANAPYAALVQQQIHDIMDGRPYGDDRYVCLPAATLAGASAMPGKGLIQIFKIDPNTLGINVEVTGSLYKVRLGAKHQAPEEKFPHSFGDTTGHWENLHGAADEKLALASGNGVNPWGKLVLVADSLGGPAPAVPAAKSGQADHEVVINAHPSLHIVQRFQRLDVNLLEDRITFEDPKTWPGSVSVTLRYQRQTAIKPDKISCFHES